MTQKTINCTECTNAFSYEPPVGYPDKRKYCDPCGVRSKEMWNAKKESFNHASESRPTHTPEGVPIAINGEYKWKTEPEVVKISDKPHHREMPKDNGFEAHLSIETVRSNALASAIQMKLNVDFYRDISPIDLAKEYEQYILTGE